MARCRGALEELSLKQARGGPGWHPGRAAADARLPKPHAVIPCARRTCITPMGLARRKEKGTTGSCRGRWRDGAVEWWSDGAGTASAQASARAGLGAASAQSTQAVKVLNPHLTHTITG